MTLKSKLVLSLDGPPEYHNRYRVYHNGRGSYDRVERGIRRLQEAHYDFGVLAVIDPSNNPEAVYKHLVEHLDAKGLDFLWPDFTHDRMPTHPVTEYGKFISKIFQIWTEQDDPSVQIRFLSSYLGILLGRTTLIYGIGSNKDRADLHLITIRSDGEVSPTDELMSTDPLTVTLTKKKVDEISLKEFFMMPIFTELTRAFNDTPKNCKSCCWENICAGGGITNRFSMINRFDNPSVYCDGLKIFFSTLLQYLIRSGIPVGSIQKKLLI